MSWYCAAEASREFDVDGSVKRDCSRWRSALGVIYLNHAARGAGGAGLGARRRPRACPHNEGLAHNEVSGYREFSDISDHRNRENFFCVFGASMPASFVVNTENCCASRLFAGRSVPAE